MADIEICFPEREVAQILWALSQAAEMAEAQDALSSLATIEGTLLIVRERFDRRGPE